MQWVSLPVAALVESIKNANNRYIDVGHPIIRARLEESVRRRAGNYWLAVLPFMFMARLLGEDLQTTMSRK